MFSGLRAWLVQRFTALWMLFFLVYVLLHFALHPGPSFAEWRAWIVSPFVRFAALLFFLSLFLHAWVGLRDVMIDYVRPLALRLALLAALVLVLAGLALWAVRVLLQPVPVVLVEPGQVRRPCRFAAGLPFHLRQPRPGHRRTAGRPERRLPPVPMPYDHELHRSLPERAGAVAGHRKDPSATGGTRILIKKARGAQTPRALLYYSVGW